MSSQQNSPTSASGSGSGPIPRNTLLGQPEELQALIVDIIDKGGDTNVDTLCRLTLTCTHMHRIARSYVFRAKDFRVFRRAVESAYVPMMRLCEQHGAAPVEITWPVRPSWREYRPIDALLLNLDERPDSRRSEHLQNRIRVSVYEALKWLLEKGADAEANLVSESFNGFRYERLDMGLGHMPTRLLKQLQINIGRPGVEMYLNVIELLSSHGFPNPTRSNALDSVLATDVVPFYHAASDWADTHPYPFVDGAITETYFTESPIDLALKSHIPPRLLELILKEYASRGVSLLTLYDECPEGLKKTCKGKRPGRDDDWKLDIMVEYEMVDVVEEALLKSILGALYIITAQISATRRGRPAQFKRSWVTLCEAVRPYCTNEYDLLETDFSENRRFFWQKYHGYEIEFILGYFDRDKVQPWYDIDVDEWCRQMLEAFTEDGVRTDLQDDVRSWCESMQEEYDEESIYLEWWKQLTRT
ncbi:hypothetical protein FOC1_g10013275 [Fusarium oxysporum f. sp. cubense race 1]|uniref:Uncharacterized protein n=1 Tax=Fusarium oxysporum f. sp. cubense (strain race 1) TaxID=1229664 RepID=N4UMR1_FUSC1|nr:hypothetical protein FOC1_g10013275 [Fusarium oxysporum f. sp. cubense race 1]